MTEAGVTAPPTFIISLRPILIDGISPDFIPS
jgi:hypothetical protein